MGGDTQVTDKVKSVYSPGRCSSILDRLTPSTPFQIPFAKSDIVLLFPRHNAGFFSFSSICFSFVTLKDQVKLLGGM